MPDKNLTKKKRNIIKWLGSGHFSIILIVCGILYFASFFIQQLLWPFPKCPFSSFIRWAPFSALIKLFFVNITLCLLCNYRSLLKKWKENSDKTSNWIFHFSFFLIFAGVTISGFTRFEGQTVLTDGNSFWGEPEEYVKFNTKGDFWKRAPKISFEVNNLNVNFWEDKLLFTGFSAELHYPADTRENKKMVWINKPVSIGGANVRLSSFGYAPVFLFKGKGNAPPLAVETNMRLFPPGMEDAFDVPGTRYRIFLRVIADPIEVDGKIENKSMNITNPMLMFRVLKNGREVFHGTRKLGEWVHLKEISISLAEIKYWAGIAIIKDNGITIIYCGFVLGLAALLVRWGEYRKKITISPLKPFRNFQPSEI